MGAKGQEAVHKRQIALCLVVCLVALLCLGASKVFAMNAGGGLGSAEAHVVDMSLVAEAGALGSGSEAESAREAAGVVLDWVNVTLVAPWARRNSHTSVVLANKMWVIGGRTCTIACHYGPCACIDSVYLSDVWCSPDGVAWTEATAAASWSPRCAHTSVLLDNKMWVIGGFSDAGYQNDVWYSSDGLEWLEATAAAPWTPRYDHASVVFHDKMWLLGGRSDGACENDVWYSSDGAIWTEAALPVPWSARYGHTALIFDDKMWVIGGRVDFASNANDVWYSPDGSTWVQATEAAPWLARFGHASAVFDSKIWVMAGFFLNDVWYSSDGVTWTETTTHAPWLGRAWYTATVFDEKIWVIAGLLTQLSWEVHPLGDVWRLAWGPFHSADPGHDNALSLSELLRVVQLYQSGAYHCDAAGEDGYAPGPGVQDCQPHSSDYHPQDWSIDLSELLRLIQLYNWGGYHYCPDAGTEDGFCLGAE